MNKDAKFFFANLGADISRCVTAAQEHDNVSYEASLDAAYHTLSYIEGTGRFEAYEEGRLLLRALEYARAEGTLPAFNESLNELIAEYSPLL